MYLENKQQAEIGKQTQTFANKQQIKMQDQ